MCLKREETISTLRGKPLKLVDQFTFISNDSSPNARDVNIIIRKEWTAIGKLPFISKCNHSDQIKQNFLQDVAVAALSVVYGFTNWTQKVLKKKQIETTQECFTVF